jgi:hypothetical protein
MALEMNCAPAGLRPAQPTSRIAEPSPAIEMVEVAVENSVAIAPST